MIRHRDLKIEDARMCAREQLHRFGVVAPEHVDPEAFAAYLNVAVMTVKLDGADAQLIKAGKRVTILLSQRIASPVVRRFTIAHELGHLLLGHPTQIPSRIPAAQIVRAPLVEIEANAFASELLMPATLVREFCDLSRGDLDGPREIANTFNVSILAAAIRYAELARLRLCSRATTRSSGRCPAPQWSCISVGAADLPMRRSPRRSSPPASIRPSPPKFRRPRGSTSLRSDVLSSTSRAPHRFARRCRWSGSDERSRSEKNFR